MPEPTTTTSKSMPSRGISAGSAIPNFSPMASISDGTLSQTLPLAGRVDCEAGRVGGRAAFQPELMTLTPGLVDPPPWPLPARGRGTAGCSSRETWADLPPL